MGNWAQGGSLIYLRLHRESAAEPRPWISQVLTQHQPYSAVGGGGAGQALGSVGRGMLYSPCSVLPQSLRRPLLPHSCFELAPPT